MNLTIHHTVEVLKRIHPTEDFELVTVERDDNLINMYALSDKLHLQFTLEELRAILRLFDVPEAT